jgi:PAS domain S-box-containing protein
MNILENDNEKNINSILAIIKSVSLVFGIIINSYENLINKNFNFDMNITQALIIVYGIFIPFMLIVYSLWSYLYLNKKNIKYSRNTLIVENFVFVFFFSILIMLSDSYSSEYKFLFLFVVISSVIQLGAKFGIIIASVSSFIILSIDLFFAPQSNVNIYFQGDLILTAALILVAWSLGKYVTFQNENIEKKDAQLQILNKKLTEQELKRRYIEHIIVNNETCYNLLINNSNDAIFVHRNNKLIFANEKAASLIGIELESLINKSILEFVPNDEIDYVENKYNDIYKNEAHTASFEQKLIGVNGIITVVQNTSTYFIYDGEPTILTILRDITSEKQVEILQKDVQKNIELLNETREFNKLITEFFSNISHELKTPLNIIFSSLQLLDLYNENDENKFMQNKNKYINIMKQNCYRLMRLINNLLDITRADSGFLVPHMKNCNIISIVEDITMSVTSFAESKGINLIFDTDCEEKIMAIDPDKIERIVLNLLSNAVKFTNCNGQILVNIFTKEDYVTISIKDNGIGIPKDKTQLIFERFRQVDRSFTRTHEGSGIGLSLVKSFVEMHEGTIEVNSQLGKGSEFIIKLPVKLCDEDYIEESLIDDNIIERISIEFSDIYS